MQHEFQQFQVKHSSPNSLLLGRLLKLEIHPQHNMFLLNRGLHNKLPRMPFRPLIHNITAPAALKRDFDQLEQIHRQQPAGVRRPPILQQHALPVRPGPVRRLEQCPLGGVRGSQAQRPTLFIGLAAGLHPPGPRVEHSLGPAAGDPALPVPARAADHPQTRHQIKDSRYHLHPQLHRRLRHRAD
jgi:hypothetical protein